MTPFTIRRATVTDLPTLAVLFDGYRQFYGNTSDLVAARIFLQQRLERGESIVLLALQGIAGVGFVQLYPSFSSGAMARTFVLNDVYVQESVRRRGIAALLLQAAEQCARSEGAVRMTLSTGVDNLRAQALYESAGWQRDHAFWVYQRALR